MIRPCWLSPGGAREAPVVTLTVQMNQDGTPVKADSLPFIAFGFAAGGTGINVTVRGKKDKTVLRKANGVEARLVLDGDYGEEQFTVADPKGFEVGYGVAIWDKNAGGFHTAVGRIIGRRGNTFAIDHSLNADCMVANEAKAARGAQFGRLQVFLTGDGAEDKYQAVGTALGLTPEAVAMAVHRLRRRFREALRMQIAATVKPEHVDEEMRSLLAALRPR